MGAQPLPFGALFFNADTRFLLQPDYQIGNETSESGYPAASLWEQKALIIDARSIVGPKRNTRIAFPCHRSPGTLSRPFFCAGNSLQPFTLPGLVRGQGCDPLVSRTAWIGIVCVDTYARSLEGECCLYVSLVWSGPNICGRWTGIVCLMCSFRIDMIAYMPAGLVGFFNPLKHRVLS